MAKEQKSTRRRRQVVAPKACAFCKEKTTPSYLNVSALQKFVSERGKILVRARTGLCAKHQRRLTIAIKHARHLALMSFVEA